MLGDAAGLARDHVGVADGVEEPGLAMVDVTHDRDDRRRETEILLAALVLAVREVEGTSSSRSSSSGETISTLVAHLGPSSSSVSSETDWVAVTISPRLNITCTSDAGLASIFSAKSVSEAPRDRRTV